MRLWSLHPKYLDSKGLVALWREGLLAQDVLAGKTKGYKHHPQLAKKFEHVDQPDQHPMFDVVKGVVAKWEVVKAVAANSFLLS